MARLEHQVEVTGFMKAAVEMTLGGLGTAAVRAVEDFMHRLKDEIRGWPVSRRTDRHAEDWSLYSVLRSVIVQRWLMRVRLCQSGQFLWCRQPSEFLCAVSRASTTSAVKKPGTNLMRSREGFYRSGYDATLILRTNIKGCFDLVV